MDNRIDRAKVQVLDELWKIDDFSVEFDCSFDLSKLKSGTSLEYCRRIQIFCSSASLGRGNIEITVNQPSLRNLGLDFPQVSATASLTFCGAAISRTLASGLISLEIQSSKDSVGGITFYFIYPDDHKFYAFSSLWNLRGLVMHEAVVRKCFQLQTVSASPN